MRRSQLVVLLFGAILTVRSAAALPPQPPYDYTLLKAFGDPPSGISSLVRGSDGVLYGATSEGGSYRDGVLFRVAADGTGFETLHIFLGSDGYTPVLLVEGQDGMLYGATGGGGGDGSGAGVVFRISTNGTAFEKLHEFLGADGYPSGLIVGSDGYLYCVTRSGGSNGHGALFRLGMDGLGFTRLHDFGVEGSEPRGLVQGSDALLYGALGSGGAFGAGALYRVATDGSGFEVLHEFDTASGAHPSAVILSQGSTLFGTTEDGGSSSAGVLFRIGADGTSFSVLHEFPSGEFPSACGLAQDSDGHLFGTTLSPVAWTGTRSGRNLFRIDPDGSGYASLLDFASLAGATPGVALVPGPGQVLYGATLNGGARNLGFLFRIDSAGAGFTQLYDLEAGDADGNDPDALVSAPGDRLYGTTVKGGVGDNGTLFTLGTDGSGFLKLRDFDASGSEGAGPRVLVRGESGILYGAARDTDAPYSGGIVYRIDPESGDFLTLHRFSYTDPSAGELPTGIAVSEADGVVYGVTRFDGTISCVGTAFRVNLDGTGFAVLHGFGEQANSEYWPTAILLGDDNALYGVASGQEPGKSGGAVFRLATDGSQYSRIRFLAGCDGENPTALVRGGDQWLYGIATNTSDPACGQGTAFKLRTDGTGFLVLHSFGAAQGHPTSVALGGDGALYVGTVADPYGRFGFVYRIEADGSGITNLKALDAASGFGPASLLQADAGALIGAVERGGPSAGGAIFKMTVPTLAVSAPDPVSEGDSSLAPVEVTVRLSEPSSVNAVTVAYKTLDGTATLADGDYEPASATLTFSPGEATKTVVLHVKGDVRFEHDESFALEIGAPFNALIGTSRAEITILNDDPIPSLSISDAAVAEGNSGARNALLTVRLSEVSGLPVTVDYATADGTAQSSARDYRSSSGTLTIPAGLLTSQVAIPVYGDRIAEPDEVFFVRLSNSVNSGIEDGEGAVTILNDDIAGQVSFSRSAYVVSEAAGFATIAVRRTGGLSGGVTVDYVTADGTATSTGPDPDCVATSGTLTFGPNRALTTFRVPLVRDTRDESDETVLLRLSNPQPSTAAAGAASLGPQSAAILTIHDDDSGGRIRFLSAERVVREGAGVAKVTVIRTLGHASGVAVHYTTAAGTATGGGTDYVDVSGDLTFPSSGIGATSQTITIPVVQDSLPEGAESFTVTLSSPTGGAILSSPSVATVTIADDEATLEFAAPTFTVRESSMHSVVTVVRSGPPVGTVSVSYATSDGTATAGLDYQAVSGSLIFADRVTTRRIIVPILRDASEDGPETVNLTLSSPSGIALGETSTAVLEIQDK